MKDYTRLQDLYVDEEQSLFVYDSETGDLIAQYDGRDSIPEEYNECLVEAITYGDATVKAYIKL